MAWREAKNHREDEVPLLHPSPSPAVSPPRAPATTRSTTKRRSEKITQRKAEELTDLLIEVGEYEKAAAIWESCGNHLKAAKLYLQAGAFEKAAECLLAIDHLEGAISCYRKIHRFDRIAQLYLSKGRTREAGIAYEEAFRYHARRADPSNPFDGEAHRAIESLEKAVSLYLKTDDYASAGRIFEKIGEYGLGIQAFLLGNDPLRAAELLERIHDRRRAIQLYRLAGAQRRADRLEGDLLHEARRYVEAAEAYRRAGEPVLAARSLACEESFSSADFKEATETFLMAERVTESHRPSPEAPLRGDDAHLYEAAHRAIGNSDEVKRFKKKFEEFVRSEKLPPPSAKTRRHPPGGGVTKKIGQLFSPAAKTRPEAWGGGRTRRLPSSAPAETLRDAHTRKRRMKQTTRRLTAGNDGEKSPNLEEKRHTVPAPPASLPCEEGTKGRYTILHEIGRGGMSRVYLAYDNLLDRKVAYKKLSLFMEDHEKVERRVLREARSMARLHHPNIVMLFDIGRCDTALYLIMEYLDGPTLAQRIHARGALDVHKSLEIFHQIGEALHFAHRHGIVHLDVKPGNILSNEQGTIFKLTDFGISRILHESRYSRSSIHFTPYYVAPEQIRGERVDVRTDIYALGVTMFEVLTGTLPYEDEHDFYTHLDDPAIDPLTRNPRLPRSLAWIVRKCMQKHPRKRYSNVRELLTELEALMR